MKLYNNTRLDTEILRKVLYRAAKAVGSVRTKEVVIKVTTSSRYLSGRVEGWWGGYYEWFLSGESAPCTTYSSDLHHSHRRSQRDDTKGRLVFSDGGFMFLRIPVMGKYNWPDYTDPLYLAEEIYRIAAHEWRHIRDKQKKKQFGQYNRRWANRPHERRAVNSANRALRLKDQRKDIQEAILDLALCVEAIRGAKK